MAQHLPTRIVKLDDPSGTPPRAPFSWKVLGLVVLVVLAAAAAYFCGLRPAAG